MRRIVGTLRKYRAFTFWMFIAILVLLLEVHFTGESAAVSTETSKGLLRSIFDVLHIEYTEDTIRSYNGIVRKCAHFSIFFVYGFSVTAALNCQHRFPRLPVALGSGAFIAVVDELRQYFVPGRATELKDMLIDFGGVCVGAAAASASIWIIRCIRNHLRVKH